MVFPRLVIVCDYVRDIPVATVEGPRDVEREHLVDAGGGVEGGIGVIVGAVADASESRGFLLGSGRRDLDRTTGRVVAEQGALWALEYVDTRNVDEIDVGRTGGRNVIAVHIHTDVGNEAGAGHLAADATDGRLYRVTRIVDPGREGTACGSCQSDRR